MITLPLTLAAALALTLSLGAAPALAAEPSAAAATPQTAEDLRDWLAGRRVEDVVGTDVYNRAGERIGAVEDIVRHRDDRSLYAVVSVGGFLGIGDREIAFPLMQMGMEGNNLIAPTGASRDALESRPAYDQGRYAKMQSAETLLTEETPPAAGDMTTGQEPMPRKTLTDPETDSGVSLGTDPGEPQPTGGY